MSNFDEDEYIKYFMIGFAKGLIISSLVFIPILLAIQYFLTK